MREEDRMVHLDKIEMVAEMIGLQHRRENVRSLQVIKVYDENAKEWVLFDPVFHGKDVVKMLYHLAQKLEGYSGTDIQFRADLLDWIIEVIKEENGKNNSIP